MATTTLLRPKALPSAPCKLSDWDQTMANWPGVCIMNVLRGEIDVERMRAAVQSVVDEHRVLQQVAGSAHIAALVDSYVVAESGARVLARVSTDTLQRTHSRITA